MPHRGRWSMPMQRDNLYQDQTLFDHLQARCMEVIEKHLPRRAEERWGLALWALGLGFGLLAAGMLLSALLAELAWNQTWARLGAAGGFTVIAWRLLTAGEAAMRRPVRKRRRRQTAPRVERRNPRNAEARAFFERLRAAGVNVRIARALVAGGVRSPEQVRAMSDEELLAIRGVGPATVRKLRACCRASD